MIEDEGAGTDRFSRGLLRTLWPIDFMLPGDIMLFLKSARTDRKLARLRSTIGNEQAFETVYRDGDPWGADSPAYRYQQRKYAILAGLLPPVHYETVLDLGCGSGHLARRMASRCGSLLGVDISESAITSARARCKDLSNVSFMVADISDTSQMLDRTFDLIIIADTLYYLPPPLTDAVLRELAARYMALLRPDGLLVLCNHYFFRLDSDSRRSRRIADIFTRFDVLQLEAEHRHPFFLTTILRRVSQSS